MLLEEEKYEFANEPGDMTDRPRASQARLAGCGGAALSAVAGVVVVIKL